MIASRPALIFAVLLLAACATQGVDPVQMETTLSNAQKAARANCPAAFADTIDTDADEARAALRDGRSTIDSLNDLNTKLIQCNEARGRPTGQTASTASPSRPVPTTDAPAKQPGCLNQTLEICLKGLHDFMYFSDDDAASALKISERVDVTGKRLGSNTIMITGRLKGADDISMVTIDFNDAKIITSFDINLPRNPAFADTQEEYDRTGLYTGLKAAFGDSCSALTKEMAYRFFQTVVKPKITREPEQVEWKWAGVSETSFQKSADLPFCGRTLTFTNLSGHDTDDISEENPSGVVIFPSITVK